MAAPHLPDDHTVEAVLTGRPAPPGLEALAGTVRTIRAVATGRPVRPSAELARRLASGDFAGVALATPVSGAQDGVESLVQTVPPLGVDRPRLAPVAPAEHRPAGPDR